MQAHRYILSSIFDLKGHITSLKNIRGSITLKPFNIVTDIYILFSSKTQSVSENAISPPCTVQVLPFILSSSPYELFSFYLPLQKG